MASSRTRTGCLSKSARSRLPSEWHGHPAVGAGAGAAAGLGLYGLWYLMSDRKDQKEFRKRWLRRLLGSMALGAGLGAGSAYAFGPQPSDPYAPPDPGPVGYWESKKRMLRNAGREWADRWKDWGGSLNDFFSQEAEDEVRRADRDAREGRNDPQIWVT